MQSPRIPAFSCRVARHILLLRYAGTLTLLPTDYSTPIIVAGRNVIIEPGAHPALVSPASQGHGVSPALRNSAACFAVGAACAGALCSSKCIRHFTLVRAEGSDSAVLDFNDTVGAVLLVGESQLTLRKLQLERLAPVTDGYTSGSYVSMTSMLWPSINAAPGSKARRQ